MSSFISGATIVKKMKATGILFVQRRNSIYGGEKVLLKCSILLLCLCIY